MRVGVDATSWDNRRGYGRFARNALAHLVALDVETTYVFFCLGNVPPADLPLGVEAAMVGGAEAPATGEGGSRGVRELFSLARAAKGAELDAYLFPSLLTWHPTPGVPSVVGVHDTIPRDHPELVFHGRRERAQWRLKERRAVATAAALFTVSRAAQAALAEALGREPDTIAVVPEAPDPVFTSAGAGPPHRLGEAPYFLCAAGGISPHKNIEGLVEGYAKLRLAEDAVPRLVVVGSLEDERYVSAAGSVRETVSSLGLDEAVVFPGYVEDSELAALYRHAEAVVNPSLAEGFGLTAVEAAACGAPLALSDIPAHRETLGGAALFFDPADPDDIAGALSRLCRDSPARQTVAERCRQAVAGLSWDDTARCLAALVHGAAGGSRKVVT